MHLIHNHSITLPFSTLTTIYLYNTTHILHYTQPHNTPTYHYPTLPLLQLIRYTKSITNTMPCVSIPLRYSSSLYLYNTKLNNTLPIHYATPPHRYVNELCITPTTLNKTLPRQYCTKPILAHSISLPYNTNT